MPGLTVGPYRLVRSHRSTYLRIYQAFYLKTQALLATIWVVSSDQHGIPEQWYIQCLNCPSHKQYPTRDKALTWLGYHLVTRHSDIVSKETTA